MLFQFITLGHLQGDYGVVEAISPEYSTIYGLYP